MALAIRTGIPPDVWERQADGAIETAFELLHEQDKRGGGGGQRETYGQVMGG